MVSEGNVRSKIAIGTYIMYDVTSISLLTKEVNLQPSTMNSRLFSLSWESYEIVKYTKIIFTVCAAAAGKHRTNKELFWITSCIIRNIVGCVCVHKEKDLTMRYHLEWKFIPIFQCENLLLFCITYRLSIIVWFRRRFD